MENGHVSTLVYLGTIHALELLHQRDENACREIQVKRGFFKILVNSYEKVVMTRMVTTESICCKDNTNITHTSGGFGFRRYVDCRTLAHLSLYLISL